jgi:hypothetical protein
MPEEMRVETMELCVTACEKFSNNNEVLASVQVAPRASGDPVCVRMAPVARSTVLLEQS